MIYTVYPLASIDKHHLFYSVSEWHMWLSVEFSHGVKQRRSSQTTQTNNLPSTPTLLSYMDSANFKPSKRFRYFLQSSSQFFSIIKRFNN